MSYLPSNGLHWQGIGTKRQPWFALPTEGLGDVRMSPDCCTLDQINQAVFSGVMPNCPCAEPAKPESPPPSGMSTGTKVAIGAAAVIGGYLLLRRKR